MISIDEVSAYPPEPERIRFVTCVGCDATVTQRLNSAGRFAPIICELCQQLNRESAGQWMLYHARLGEAA